LGETDAAPWPDQHGGDIPAHEFHYASLENLPADTSFAYTVKRGYGINGNHDGIVIGHLLATFSHQRNVNKNPWAERFAAFVRDKKGFSVNRVSA